MVMIAKILRLGEGRIDVINEADGQEVIVHTRRRDLAEGELIKIVYNGITALSLPPQISAMRIIKLGAQK